MTSGTNSLNWCVCYIMVYVCVCTSSLNFFPNPKDGSIYALGKSDHLEVSGLEVCIHLTNVRVFCTGSEAAVS